MFGESRKEIDHLNQRVLQLIHQARYAEAVATGERACNMARKSLRRSDQVYATSLSNLASAYHKTGNYAAAEPLYRETLEIRRKGPGGEDHYYYAISLNNLGMLYRDQGKYQAAEPLLQQALEVYCCTLGEDDPHYAQGLNNLAALLCDQGNYRGAERLLRQALEIYRRNLGQNHPEYARVLSNLASLYHQMDEYATAEPLQRQALEIRRRALGENHPDSAMNLNNLAVLYRDMGNWDAAAPLFQQVLEILRRAVGEDHPSYAQCLGNLGVLFETMGDYDVAEPLLRQAVDVYGRVCGTDHPDYAQGLNNLGILCQTLGNYAAAESLFRQVQEIRRRALGTDHPDYAQSLSNLGLLYLTMGSYEAAEPLFKQAVEICHESLGENSAVYAIALNNLGGLYHKMGNGTAALQLFGQALEIRRRALGEDHPNYAMNLNNLALLYCDMGIWDAAEPLFRQALEIRQRALGEDHPNYAQSLSNLAMLHRSRGDYAAAEPLLQQAVEVYRQVLGQDHPDYAHNLGYLAMLYAAIGNASKALTLLEEAAAVHDRMIGQIFSIGSESKRLAYLALLREELDVFLSLVSQHLSTSPEAARKALDLVLRRKALGVESLAVQRDAIIGGRYPKLEPRLRELNNLRQQIAQRTLTGPGPQGLSAHQQLLTGLNEQKERLETELACQIPEMNLEQQLRTADRQTVAQALPPGTALVEFVRFNLIDFQAVPANGEVQQKPAHYLAFILPAGEPDQVQMIDLNEAELIDHMITTFRSSITGEDDGNAPRDLVHPPGVSGRARDGLPGIDLYEAVFAPLCVDRVQYQQLFLCPDGDLARLPFEVLPLTENQRLIDCYHISYLTVGRDVLRFGAAFPSQLNPALVIADPDFDLVDDSSIAPSHADRSVTIVSVPSSGSVSRQRNFANIYFGRLPGTRAEGEYIASMLGVQPWLEGDALESRVKGFHSPCILHIATHGFFLADQKQQVDKKWHDLDVTAWKDTGTLGQLTGAGLENPMLRSGLALAGANTWCRGGAPPIEAEDGILTAEDVSGLDLLGTELVVLSACETGLGQVHAGEGVFGLRRSFVVAGAKTLIMSLWKVPDEQTQELMENFYRLVMNGQPRAEALREAQLTIRAKYPDVFDWGAFICQGDPGLIGAEVHKHP